MKITLYHLLIFFLIISIAAVPAFANSNLAVNTKDTDLKAPIEGVIELLIGIAMILSYKTVKIKEQLLKP